MPPRLPDNILRRKPTTLYVWEIEYPAGLLYFGPYLTQQDALDDPSIQGPRKRFRNRLIEYTES